jgi:hypothetical protein
MYMFCTCSNPGFVMMTMFKKSEEKSKDSIKGTEQPIKKQRKPKKINSVLSTLSNYLRISHTEIKQSKKLETVKISNTANPVGKKEAPIEPNDCLPSQENESKQAIELNSIHLDSPPDDQNKASKEQSNAFQIAQPFEIPKAEIKEEVQAKPNEVPLDNLRQIKNMLKEKELEAELSKDKPVVQPAALKVELPKEIPKEETKNNSMEYEARYCTVCNIEQV